MWDSVLPRLGPAVTTKWLARAGRGRLVVLCYHDLRNSDDFTSWLRVDVDRFADHLSALSEHGRFVSPAALDDLEALPEDRLHFLVTFDDGYANNLRLGADVLERSEVPALFFVSTHHVTTGEAFWFDRVVTRIQAPRLRRLNLSQFGLREYRFFATDGTRRWNDIQVLLTDLKRLGNPTDPAVSRILDFLDSEYGAASEEYDRRLRPLTVSELKDLSHRRHVFFGSHGHRHEILPRLDNSELAANLSTSRQILEGLVGTPIEHVAYPNGDEDQRVRDACFGAGYRRGYVTKESVVPKQFQPLRIPRLLIGGYDTDRDVIDKVKGLLLVAGVNELLGASLGS